VKNSFPALMGAFGDDDEIAVYRFDKHVEKLMDFSSDDVLVAKTFEKLTSVVPPASSVSSGPFSSPGPVINGVPITPGVDSVGRTIAPPTKVLHDALFAAAEDLDTRALDRRRIVFVASDGRNQNSQHSFNAARDRLLLRDVHVFAFGVDTSVFQRFRSDLLSYTRETGGDTCFPESQGTLEACYFLSTEQARNQYVLGYVSTNPRPSGKPVFREIKVQVRREGIELRHKKGYYQSP
jgi:VWFA-related protein